MLRPCRRVRTSGAKKRYAAERLQTVDVSYLFVVFTGFRSVRDIRDLNPFVVLSHRKIKAEDAAYRAFLAAVDSMYRQLAGSGALAIEPMSEGEIRDYAQYWFNGFQSDFLTDAEASESFIRVGDRFVGAVSIEHERQFPETLRSPQVSRLMKISTGILEDLGVVLPLPHICNQIIVLSGHDKEVEQVKRTLDSFRKNRGFSEELEDQVHRLDKTREELSDDLDALLVRGHTNVLFWAETEDLLKTYRNTITNFMKQLRDFEPVVPTGGELRNVFYCSHPRRSLAWTPIRSTSSTSGRPSHCSSIRAVTGPMLRAFITATLSTICRCGTICTMRRRSTSIRATSPSSDVRAAVRRSIWKLSSRVITTTPTRITSISSSTAAGRTTRLPACTTPKRSSFSGIGRMLRWGSTRSLPEAISTATASTTCAKRFG